MTSPLLDPQQTAFWAADPAVALTAPPPTPPPPPTHRVRLALELAAAFLVCARLVRAKLAARSPYEDPRSAAEQSWGEVKPLFTSMVAAAVAPSLLANDTVVPTSISSTATRYARGLTEYVAGTSIDAFVGAVDRQLAGRWSERVAWSRAAAGFGLDRQAYATYLGTAGATVSENLVGPAAQAQADQALLDRAQLIGESEAHTSTEAAKTLSWAERQQAGELPPDAQRRWVTVLAEGDCSMCRSLDRKLANLQEPFIIGGRKVWSPQAHPNCRCHLELVTPFAKAGYRPGQRRAADGEWVQERLGEPPGGKPVTVAEPETFAEQVQRELEQTAAPVFGPKEPATGVFAPTSTGVFARPGVFAPTGSVGPVFAPAKSEVFGAQGSTVFGSESVFGAGDTFTRRRRPQLRILLRRVIMPPPPMELQHHPYYLPTDLYHLETNPEELHQLLGDAADVNFDAAHPTKLGALHAIAAPSPWDALNEEDLARGRIGVDQNGDPVVGPQRIRELWARVRRYAVPAWHDAISYAEDSDIGGTSVETGLTETHGTQRGLVARLDDTDRQLIANMANFTGYSDDEDLTAKIVQATRDMGTGNDSLASAYADYIVYNRPDLLGETGAKLESAIDKAEWAGMNLRDRPVDQVLVFEQGFHPGTRITPDTADVRGGFIVTPVYQDGHEVIPSITYTSALNKWGHGTPPLHMGLQQAHVQPFESTHKPPFPRPGPRVRNTSKVDQPPLG